VTEDPREITFVVDGREVTAAEGAMLVDAAKQGDVEIPVFCYEPKLGPPVGACRMCLVEIEGIPKLQTACSTPVRDGMVVYTQTEQVREAQNSVVEFLLVNHPLDCPVCDKGGECPLQDISMGWGPGRSRFTDQKRHFEKPLPLSPLVAIDRERCILCYRCVRFSQEVAEDEQLQLLERGDRSYVGTFEDRPYVAPFHGNITELCPVGALTNYTYRFRARPWDIEQAGSICTLCPSQCNVSFTVRDEQVNRVMARDNSDVDDGWLCDKGRYGFEMLAAPERITTPLVRAGGTLREATWTEAAERAAAGLRGTGAKTAALVGDATNEEGYLVQRILRQALGSPHVDSRLRGGAGRKTLAALSRPDGSAAVRDIDSAGAILVLGVDPMHAAPILDLRIRKAVRREGAALCVAGERPTTLDGGARETVRYAPGGTTAFIDSVAAGESAGEGVAAALRDADAPVVLWGERMLREAGAADALLRLAEALPSARFLGVPETTNARGLREVGCLPDAGPGFSQTQGGYGANGIPGALAGGELTGLILFGADPVRDAPDPAAWKAALSASDFTVAFAMFPNDSTAAADVVFPLMSHAENEGSATHPDGRLQRLRPSAQPPGDIRPPWLALTELAAGLGHETGLGAARDVFAAIAADVPFYGGMTYEEIGGRGLRWQERVQAESLSSPEGSAGGPSREDCAFREGSPAGPSDEAETGLRLGTYRDIWAGPVTELNPALAFLKPRQQVEIAVEDAQRIGLTDGDQVEVAVDAASVRAVVKVSERARPGAVFLIEGTEEANANALLNGGGETVAVRKLDPADLVEVVR